MPQTPRASRRYRTRLAAITAAAIVAARRAWAQMKPSANWEDQYQRQVAPQALALALAAQTAATQESDSYVADVLTELAFGPPTSAGVLNVAGFRGFAGDGRLIEGLLAQTVTTAGRTYNDLAQAAQVLPDGAPTKSEMARMALGSTQDYMDAIFHEIIAETARAAESAATVQRPWVEGWVRMLTPPSCLTCAVLAGRFYLWNAGFERHPGCDCVHIPASEASSTDLRTNPNTYFDSLSEAEQNRIFTNAGARAIRDGADMYQVVGARRGMSTGQSGRLTRVDVNGIGTFVTTSGTTKRAWFGGGHAAKKFGYEDWFRRAGYAASDKGRRGAVKNYVERRTKVARLMPESIYELAKDREDAIRLLQMYGYIT